MKKLIVSLSLMAWCVITFAQTRTFKCYEDSTPHLTTSMTISKNADNTYTVKCKEGTAVVREKGASEGEVLYVGKFNISKDCKVLSSRDLDHILRYGAVANKISNRIFIDLVNDTFIKCYYLTE